MLVDSCFSRVPIYTCAQEYNTTDVQYQYSSLVAELATYDLYCILLYFVSLAMD